jgi:hypothetical protein
MLKIRGKENSAQCWRFKYKHQPEQVEGEGRGVHKRLDCEHSQAGSRHSTKSQVGNSSSLAQSGSSTGPTPAGLP